VESSSAGGVIPEHLEALQKLKAAEESRVVEQALAAAQQHLRMDAAYLTTIDSRQQTVEAIVGDPGPFARFQGIAFPIEQTLCARMLSGEIPNAIPDTRAEPLTNDLDVTNEFHAYIGVPVKLSDGRVHGSFCCVSSQVRPDLGADEVRFMQVLADIVAARLEQVHGNIARLTERFRARWQTA